MFGLARMYSLSSTTENSSSMHHPKSGVEKMPQREDRIVDILGVQVNATDITSASASCEKLIANSGRGFVCVTGVHGMMEAQDDAGFRSILNRSFLTVPDGMPLVWVGRLRGFSEMRRVYGPDLMIEICGRSVRLGYRHFLCGGNTGVAEELAERLRHMVPGLNIVGTFTPPFRPLSWNEENQLFKKVAECRPDVIWVGLSTPKQERFMAQYLDRLETKLMIGVGAAFDIHTGRINDAPGWVKKLGLQWLHRLAQEPRRLWRRYLINNPRFIFKIALQLAGVVHYSL